MSRATVLFNSAVELNSRLESTINDLHRLGARLVGLNDPRKPTPDKTGAGNTDQIAPPLLDALATQQSILATNLGYIDGLVRNIEAKVFDDESAGLAGSAR